MSTRHRYVVPSNRHRRSVPPLLRLAVAVSLALGFAAEAVPIAAGFGPLCATTQIQPQCIDAIAITPHGTYADFAFHLTSARLATLEVSEVAPYQQADGTWSLVGKPTTFFQLFAAANAHTVRIPDLQPHHTYHYLINALKGQIGNDAQQTGTFATLSRHVAVSFTSIHVTDDSDDLSAGDLTFWFYADGWLVGPSNGILLSYPLDASEAKVSSGNTITLDANQYRKEIIDAPDAIVLKVYGIDNDCEGVVPLPGWPQELCTLGTSTDVTNLPTNPGSGSTNSADWATAGTPLLNVVHNGPGEAYASALNWGTANANLKFEVTATLTVWYA
jgi:hypothetical protein